MKRLAEHAKVLEEIKGRVARKEYDKITANLKMMGPNDSEDVLEK